MKTDSEKKLTRNTGFYERTSKLTETLLMLEDFGCLMIIQSMVLMNEYTACREKAVVIDLSSSKKI